MKIKKLSSNKTNHFHTSSDSNLEEINKNLKKLKIFENEEATTEGINNNLNNISSTTSTKTIILGNKLK